MVGILEFSVEMSEIERMVFIRLLYLLGADGVRNIMYTRHCTGLFTHSHYEKGSTEMILGGFKVSSGA